MLLNAHSAHKIHLLLRFGPSTDALSFRRRTLKWLSILFWITQVVSWSANGQVELFYGSEMLVC